MSRFERSVDFGRINRGTVAPHFPAVPSVRRVQKIPDVLRVQMAPNVQNARRVPDVAAMHVARDAVAAVRDVVGDEAALGGSDGFDFPGD